MTTQIGGMLLLGWLWSMAGGSYYLPLVTLMLFIMLMVKGKVSFFSSLLVAVGSALATLLLYSFIMAVVEFIESMLRVRSAYELPTHMWLPALVFYAVFTLLNIVTIACVRQRYTLPIMTIVSICVISNSVAGLIAYLIPPLVLR